MKQTEAMNKVTMDEDGDLCWTKTDEEIAEFKKKWGLDKLKK